MSESERKNRPGEDEGFDELVESSLGELPPDYIAVDVSPWKKAIDRVVLGTALSMVTLNFLYLNYILPLIGTIQLLLGLRRLRRENRAFAVCYAYSIFRVVLLFASLILNAMCFNGRIYAQINLVHADYFIAGAAPLVYLLCLSKAMGAVHRKAGLSGKVRGATALVVWYIIFILLALINYSGLIVGAVIIVAYVFIIVKLAGLPGELDEAGYSVRCAGVRVSDGALALSLLGVLAAAIVCCFAFFSSFPMDWQPVEAQRGQRAQSISGQLAELGYPEELLGDLTEEDLLECEGAARIYAEETRMYSFDGEFIYTSGVAVELPGGERWRVFHHFRWADNADFRGTEAIDIIPVLSRSDGSFFDSGGRLGGRLLCRRDGVDCEAPFYYLGSETYTTYSFFGGSTYTHVNADFSLPNGAQERRGYVSLELELMDDEEGYVNSWMYYVHQEKMWNYPVSTAGEARRNGLSSASPFDSVSDQLHFFPSMLDEAPD